MKDLKYLFAYTVPISAYISFEFGGVLSYTAVFYAFVVLPFLDIISSSFLSHNSTERQVHRQEKQRKNSGDGLEANHLFHRV